MLETERCSRGARKAICVFWNALESSSNLSSIDVTRIHSDRGQDWYRQSNEIWLMDLVPIDLLNS